jgi:hypothetical protein
MLSVQFIYLFGHMCPINTLIFTIQIASNKSIKLMEIQTSSHPSKKKKKKSHCALYNYNFMSK